MSTLKITFFILVLITLIDFLSKKTIQCLNDGTQKKVIGIFQRILLCIVSKERIVENKELLIKRLFLSLTFTLFYLTYVFLLIKNALILQVNDTNIFIFIIPIAFAPFFYLFFGLLSNESLIIYASIRQFHMRAVLYFLIASCIVFSNFILINNTYIKLIYFFLGLSAFIYINFLFLTERKQSSNNISQGAFGEILFFYLLICMLDIIYLLLMLYTIFLKDLSIFANNYPLLSAVILIAFMSGLAHLVSKAMINNRLSLSFDLFESWLIPASFLLLALVHILFSYALLR